MGMFDFVKDAGEALTEKVLGSTDAEEAIKTDEISQERIDELRKANIEKSIAALDIDGEVVTVAVNGGTVVLSGNAPSQEALEKIVLCAGNQFGIEQVDCQLQAPQAAAAVPEPAAAAPSAPAEAAAPAAESTFYTVQSGDTLGKIAQEHYGAASKYTAIFEANQPMLTDPDKIYVGQKLRIPAL